MKWRKSCVASARRSLGFENGGVGIIRRRPVRLQFDVGNKNIVSVGECASKTQTENIIERNGGERVVVEESHCVK